MLGLDVGAEGGSGLAGWCWVWDAEDSEDVCEVVLSVGDQSLWIVSIVLRFFFFSLFDSLHLLVLITYRVARLDIGCWLCRGLGA